MIKDVLRHKLHGRMSHEAIARRLCISKGVVAKYTALANAAGLVACECETENGRLKKMYAELALENAAISDVLSRKL